jgi:hypothetical protein
MTSDAGLLAAARTDPDAFDELYRRSAARIYGYFARRAMRPPPTSSAGRAPSGAGIRYVGRFQNETSRAIKYERRVMLRIASKRGARLTLAGTVTGPRASRPARRPSRDPRRATCSRYEPVRRVRPDARGRFRATVTLPPDSPVGIYQARTRVPATNGGRKLFRTYSLPRIAVR